MFSVSVCGPRSSLTCFAVLAADLRAILASHISFEFVDRRMLRSANEVECDGLIGVASQAANFEVAIASVYSVAEGR